MLRDDERKLISISDGDTLGDLVNRLTQAPGAVQKLGKIKSITDHAGRKLGFAYEDSGRLVKLTESASDPLERTTSFGYESGATLDHPQLAGDPSTPDPLYGRVTDARGVTSRTVMDSEARPLAITEALGKPEARTTSLV